MTQSGFGFAVMNANERFDQHCFNRFVQSRESSVSLCVLRGWILDGSIQGKVV